MKTIDIQVTATIFDDPEYCRTEKGECEFVDNNYNPPDCQIFDSDIFFSEATYPYGDLIKCDQCKEAYKKAKYTSASAGQWKQL